MTHGGHQKDADLLYGFSPVVEREEQEDLVDYDLDEEEDESGDDGGTRRDFQGIPCVIEYEKGSLRPMGEPGTGSDVLLGYPILADYGYIEDTISSEEGEERDVFIGPDEESSRVFVLQLRDMAEPQILMEEKVLLGFYDFDDAQDFAKHQYFSEMVENIYEMSMQDLKDQITAEKSKAQSLARLREAKLQHRMLGDQDSDRLAETSGTGDTLDDFVIIRAGEL